MEQSSPQTFMTVFAPNSVSCSSTPGKFIEKPVLILTIEIPLVFFFLLASFMYGLLGAHVTLDQADIFQCFPLRMMAYLS